MTWADLPAWLAWGTVAGVLAAADVLFGGAQLILAAAGGAAAAAAVGAALGAGTAAQAWILVAALAAFVPAVLRLRPRPHGGGHRESDWAAGGVAAVEDRDGRRVIHLMGDDHPVRLTDGTKPSPGTRVRVRRIEGITMIADAIGPAESHRNTEGVRTDPETDGRNDERNHHQEETKASTTPP